MGVAPLLHSCLPVCFLPGPVVSLMGSRFPSHQLSNGLYVSGRPEQPKERPPTMSSVAMPYTGGDIKKSGELGKMFDIPVDGSRSRKSGPINNAPSRTGSFGGAASHSGPIMSNSVNRPGSVSSAGIPGSGSAKKTNSGPLNRHGDPVKKSSGPQPGGGNSVSRQNSGPLAPVLPTTGLITSGPISSGPLNSSGAPRKVSGPLDSTGSVKLHAASIAHNQAVTNLSQEDEYSFHRSFPKPILWSMILLFVMGFIAGGFILGAVHNPILLIVVVVLFGAVAAVFIWNTYWGRRAITGFIARYPDAELRTARDGQFVKVSGVCKSLRNYEALLFIFFLCVSSLQKRFQLGFTGSLSLSSFSQIVFFLYVEIFIFYLIKLTRKEKVFQGMM